MKRQYGVGRIEQRGDKFKLRYSINGEKFNKTVAAGSKAEAQKQLRSSSTPEIPESMSGHQDHGIYVD